MPSFERHLGDGLVLRVVRDEHDAARYYDFHAALFDHATYLTTVHLSQHHPAMGLGDFLYVEDERTGAIVSTTCLIPWRCRYGEVTLNVAMLEMVGTHRDYRRRGLIRAQVEHFHQMVKERGYDLSVIEGIPYYYRQFGYTYAIDHRAYDSLPSWCLPEWPAQGAERYALRPAVEGDVPQLTRLYQEAIRGVQFTVLRDEAYMRFLVSWARFPLRVVEERATGRLAGYVAAMPLPGGRGTRVQESAILSQEVGRYVLQQLKAEAGGEIQLGWPASGTLVQLGRSLGATPLPVYQWLLRLPDVVTLLQRITTVLEQRLANSDCAGLTTDLVINLFREAFRLHFREGKLEGVEAAGFVDASIGADGGDLCIPPDAFVRLLFGYRTLVELDDAWPDLVIRASSRHLLEVLFPRMTSYFLMPYMYCGA